MHTMGAILGASIGALALAAAMPLHAETEYPTRTIKIVAPAPPGGMSDAYSRLIAAKLAERWSQPAIVENRSGSGGYIGAEYVARSPADGYTLIMGTITTNALTTALFDKPSYDPERDFAPVALVAEAEGVAVVPPSMPVRSLSELIAYAKVPANRLSIAAGGIGTAGHLAAELFRTMAQVPHVEIAQYRGMAPMVNDLIGGQIPLGFATMQTAVPHIRAGSLRALAVIGSTRSVALPELPTMAEAGLPGFEVVNWIGLFAPAGTPPDVIRKLNAEVMRVMQLPEMRERLPSDGGRFAPNTPEEFGAFVRADIAKWGPLVKASGARME